MTTYRKTRSCGPSEFPLGIEVIPDDSIPIDEAVLVSRNSKGEIVDAVRGINLQTEEKKS